MNELAIHTFGQGSRPIVWFHGWGFDSQIWLDILPDLLAKPRQYQIILVDLPGFGASSHMSWAEFKSHLLSHLPAQFSLLGWSLGGLFATRLANEAPHRIKQLIQVASSPYFIQTTEWPGIVSENLDDFYQQFTLDPMGTRQQFVQSQCGGAHAYVPLLVHGTQEADAISDSAGLSVPHNDIIGLTEGLSILKQWDLRSYLQQLPMPVAYLFGRLDRIVPFHTYSRMRTLYPQFQYTVFPKSGHMPFLSHKQAFLEWLEDILHA